MTDLVRVIAGAACCGGLLLVLAFAWAMARMAGLTDQQREDD